MRSCLTGVASLLLTRSLSDISWQCLGGWGGTNRSTHRRPQPLRDWHREDCVGFWAVPDHSPAIGARNKNGIGRLLTDQRMGHRRGLAVGRLQFPQDI